jgi:hypothetical protein
MALTIDTLLENKKVFNPDPTLMSAKQGIWDLTNGSLSFKNVELQFDGVYYVSEDAQMRLDLFAANKYGDQGKIGSLLKVNGYSNPFAISTGQILYIPTLRSINSAVAKKKELDKSGNTNSSPSEAFKKNQERKIARASEGRKKFIDSKVKNAPAQVLPPNFAQDGQPAVIRTNDGRILYGANSGGGSNSGTNL